MVEVMKHQLIQLRCYCLKGVSKIQHDILSALSHVHLTQRLTLRKALLKSREDIYLSLQVCKLYGGQIGNIFQWKDLILFCFLKDRTLFREFVFPIFYISSPSRK